LTYSVRFDWLQGKLSFSSFFHFARFLDSFLLPFGDRWSLTNSSFTCGQRFSVGFKSVGGLRGGYNLTPDGLDVLLQVQGSLLSSLGSEDQYSLVLSLQDAGCRFTRCDIALDDYDRRVNSRYLRSLAFRGAYRLLDSFRIIESRITRGVPPVPTLYFGNSHKILRFYDAEFCHDIPADRWELQLRGTYPSLVIADYLANPNCLSSYVVGSIDFGHSPTGHYRDFYRYSFWQSLIDEVAAGAPKKLKSSPLTPDIYRSMGWLSRQGGVILSTLHQGLQDSFSDWIDSVCRESSERMTSYHHQQAKFLQDR
jgi:Replication initiation factor